MRLYCNAFIHFLALETFLDSDNHCKLAPAAAAQVPAPLPCSERGTTHKVYKLSPGGKGGLFDMSIYESFVTIPSVDYGYISKEF